MHGEAPFEPEILGLSCPCIEVCKHQMLLLVELERTWADLSLGVYLRVNFPLVGFLSFWEQIWLHGSFGTLGPRKINRPQESQGYVICLGRWSSHQFGFSGFVASTVQYEKQDSLHLEQPLSDERSQAPFLSFFMPVFSTVVSHHFLGGY